MPAPKTTLLIEGTFHELAEELHEYIENLRKAQSDTEPPARVDFEPLLAKVHEAEESGDEDGIEAARDEVLKPLVQISVALNTAPEKEFIAAYNLLIHLIHQSSDVDQFLRPICRNLTSDIPPARFGLSLSVLTTIFNVLAPDDDVRLPIFDAILNIISRSATYESLRPQLKYLDAWLTRWESNSAQRRRLYLRISKIAKEGGEEEDSYEYLIRALRTVSSDEAKGGEARELSLQALKTALNSPTHFDFEDLTALDSIQALRNSDPILFDLLEIFTSQQVDDYVDFKDEHEGLIDSEGLDDIALTRKIRLLSLASLAASTGDTRTLPYSSIARALQIPSEDVEMWVIDVIRAGLVEGKLSQLNQTFLIHRSTYRVFTELHWREVALRLNMWKTSLVGVLGVIRQEKENLVAQREAEQEAANAKLNGTGATSRYSRPQRDTIDVGMD